MPSHCDCIRIWAEWDQTSMPPLHQVECVTIRNSAQNLIAYSTCIERVHYRHGPFWDFGQTVFYTPNRSVFSPFFFKSWPFFRTPPFLRTKNTLEILLFHHSLASSSSLSGCFRLRNSASNTSKLTFANKMFSKFSNLYLTPQPALEFDLIGLHVAPHSAWLTNCSIQLQRAVA